MRSGLVTYILLSVVAFSWTGDSLAVTGVEESTVLHVDPRLIAEAAEVWSVIATDDNAVWPGWNAAETPILFYLPGKQDLLINHPRPPDGFVPYTGAVPFPGGKIDICSGRTMIDWDGQNTSRKIGGVDTLVVADTLSNLRMRLVALMDDPRPGSEKLPRHDYSPLTEEPYGQLAMIAHEAFHVFQRKAAPGKGGDELALLEYPVLSASNNVGFALEGAALREAIGADTREACREAAVRWLAVRLNRRTDVPESAVKYEDGIEFIEGLAKYVEYRLSRVIEGRTPGEAMKWIQGFRGYGDLGFFRERLLDEMVKQMRGEVNVNNDPHGTAPLRMRLYFSGMAAAVLLDRLSPGWKARITEPGATLTGLVRQAVDPSFEEMEKKLDEALSGDGYDVLLQAKEQLEQEGRSAVAKMVDGILDGSGTLLVIDYAALGDPAVAMAFTPFGIVSVDEHRTIYRMIPVKARMGQGYTFEQTDAIPLLQDREKKRFLFRLPEAVPRRTLADLLEVEPDGISGVSRSRCDLALPGVRLKAARASFDWSEEEIVVSFLRPR